MTKFDWVATGNKLYYDYYRTTDTLRDFRLLLIANRFYEQDPANSSSYQLMFRILARDFVVKKGGLYGIACESCGFLGCSGKFEFLYAPNKASLNQELPLYGCSRTPYSFKNKIVEVDKVVTVPKGTFTTYVMLHENGDKSYWNADEGLIMYDRYDFNGSFIGSLKLNRIVR